MDEKVAKTPRPHMLDADEVAELLRIKKGSAYEVIRKINAEQEARGVGVARRDVPRVHQRRERELAEPLLEVGAAAGRPSGVVLGDVVRSDS